MKINNSILYFDKNKKNQSQLTVYDNVKISTSQVQIELELLEPFCYEI